MSDKTPEQELAFEENVRLGFAKKGYRCGDTRCPHKRPDGVAWNELTALCSICSPTYRRAHIVNHLIGEEAAG